MRLFLIFLCLAPPLAAAPPRKSHVGTGRVISSIKIETHNVFETDVPPENKFIYKAANRIHIKTFDMVVERELLFEVGHIYDPLLIEETERNLRELSFIRRAEITGSENPAGGVDVTVRTWDSWTLEVVASFKRVGGLTSVKAGLAEHNILGQGKSGSAVYSRDGATASKSLSYKDPQFLRYKRFEYAMSAYSGPESRYYSLSLNRPFYASIARRAGGGLVTYSSNKVRGYTRDVGEAGAYYGIALATSTARTRRITFGLSTRRAKSVGPDPDLEQLTFLKAGADWQELDFLTVRRIQNFTRDEYYNLGLAVLPSVAWAPKLKFLATTEAQVLPRIDVRKGFTWSNQLLLLKSGYGSKYADTRNGNGVASFDASYFVRGLPFQTLALHAGLDLGWDLDTESQLGLGEVNGLRGYGLNEFSGSRRFLFNIEDRIYVYDDFLRILDVGAVVFFDSGYAWPVTQPVSLRELKSSVGLGLRVAPSRSGSNSPVRIDLAFPLVHGSSRTRYSISILAGQAF